MIWNEHAIARAVALQTLAKKCVVLVDNCNWTGHECDVLAVTRCLRIIDVEVKISRSDLKADAKKDKWWKHLRFDEAVERGLTPADGSTWRRDMWTVRAPQTHPRKVWKHYYALPADIWKPELLECLPSPACGEQHVDAPEAESDFGEPWDNPPHRSHLCAKCGHVWRPADVPTNGVAAVNTKGKNDSPPPGQRVLFINASKFSKGAGMAALMESLKKPPHMPLQFGLPTMHGLAGRVRMFNEHGAVELHNISEPAAGQVWRFTIGDAIHVSKAELLDVTPGTLKIRYLGAFSRPEERLRRDRIHLIERVPAEENPF